MDVLSVQFDDTIPVGEPVSLGGATFLSASYRAAESVSNELATDLTLTLERLDTSSGGVVEGALTSTFPSVMLDGTFSANACDPP